MTVPTTTPDYAAIKRKQQATWASGDYSAVAARIVPISERLAETADLRAGERVLDVATGTGSAALAAARRGSQVVGLDYVPALLDQGRARAAAEGLPVEFVEGDAEDLPFEDDSFDAVISVVGVMFAPDHRRAASELVRVGRPGARIALASWTPDGFIGQLLRLVGRYVPPPAGVEPPTLWGAEQHLREIFGDSITTLDVHTRTYDFTYRSPDEFAEFFVNWYGPTERAAESLDADTRLEFVRDLAALAAEYDRLDGGPIAAVAEYTEAIAVVR